MLLLEQNPLALHPGEWSRDPTWASQPVPGHHFSGRGGLTPRRATLMLWTGVTALAHFDRGAVTVAALGLATSSADASGYSSTQLSFGHVAALSAWHSVGLALGGILAGAAFQQASAKVVLVLALSLDAFALLVVGLKTDLGLVTISILRAISGLAASLPLAFLPLWVDEYAPSECQPQWMAMAQMGAPIGHFLGIVVAGVVVEWSSLFSSGFVDWHFALFIQALLMIPVILWLGLIPSGQIGVANISSLRVRLDSLTLHPTDDEELSRFGECREMIQGMLRETREGLQGLGRNPNYVSITLALCFLHTTGAGLALWMAPYLMVSSGAPSFPLLTLMLVGAVLAVGPMAGSHAGAIICDRLEGFRGGHHADALRVACGFVALAALTGPLTACFDSFAGLFGLLCLWLFAAGAYLPVSTGVLMTSMPSYLRSFSTASSVLAFHSVCFAASPIIVAGIMDCFANSADALGFGVGLYFWMSAPAAVVLLVAYTREPKSSMPMALAGADDLTFSEISYELARRRMSTVPL